MLLAATACTKINGEGPLQTETRNATGFNGIDLRMAGNVYVTADSVYKVEVHAQQNILDEMKIYVANEKLVIRFENDVKLRRHEPITVYVSTPALNAVRISGSGSVATTNRFAPNKLELDVSGSGSIEIADLVTPFVDANISGSGDILLNNGTAVEERFKISGSGNINALNVVAQKARTTTSGSGNMRLHVTDDLDVTISGSGDVYYNGLPHIDIHVSGSGKLVQL